MAQGTPVRSYWRTGMASERQNFVRFVGRRSTCVREGCTLIARTAGSRVCIRYAVPSCAPFGPSRERGLMSSSPRPRRQ
jgi:hypothetical protein